jgi:hypothetical protein
MNEPNCRLPTSPEHHAEPRGFTLQYEDGMRISRGAGMMKTFASGPLIRRMKVPSPVAAGLILGITALSACSQPYSCGGDAYRGDCVAGAALPATPTPEATPAPEATPVAPAHAAVPYGDPKDFAVIDDKQCRTYGLTFGSHDYADCRIRLSAQHRGLDPNIGAAAPGSGNK